MSNESKMTVEFYDDGTSPDRPLFFRLREQEKALAEKEGREPEGWFWTEGMDEPRAIDFEEETPNE